jgi:NTP pyrophosphatase (non-canonical NTP hydrolase)
MSDLDALTEAMHAFVESKGWYEPDSPHPQTPRALAISLALEAAEVLEHFQWTDPAWADLSPELRAELGAELADVLLYLLQIASLAGIALDQAVRAKLRINAGRTWDDPHP